MSRLRRWLHRRLPDHHQIFATRGLRWLAPWLDHPAYWVLNRRKVALAFAVGLFAGLMPGPTQMLTAGLLALWLRINLPVAVLTTLYTNPLTYLPLYYLAYRYGAWLLGLPPSATMGAIPTLAASPWEAMQQLGAWMAALGQPLLVGVPALGLTLGAAGYLLLNVLWRCATAHAWRHRRRKNGVR